MRRVGADFHRVRVGRKTENLKNWISDTQTGEMGSPGFQVFTHTPAARKSGRVIPGRSGVGDIPNAPQTCSSPCVGGGLEL